MGCAPSQQEQRRLRNPNLKSSDPTLILFTKYDKDKSGKISQKEFYDLCFSMGYKLTPEELALDMQLLGDKDALIEYSVFAKWWHTENRFAKMQWSDKQMEKIKLVREMFDKYDTDHSGKVDQVEFKEMHKAILYAKLSTKPCDLAIKEIDLDGDGKIDYQEYLKFVIGAAQYHTNVHKVKSASIASLSGRK